MNMKKLRINLFTAILLMIVFFPHSVDAREIIPSTATTLEELQAQIMAEVEAARGHEADTVQAEAAILADPITKNVIYEKNADATMYPASTTKLMSFVIALESINSGAHAMSDQVTISPEAEAITEGDVGLKAGEVYSLQDLLLAMSVISANDAALAVAEYIAGSEEQYVEMMNAKGSELGMTGTHYVNSCGLHDDNHYTTARDLLTLSIYAVNVDGLIALTSTPNFTINLSTGSKVLTNTNRLLSWYPGNDGLKTGFTTPAGYCLTATAVRGDMRLISVVMGCNVQYSHYSEAEAVTADTVVDRIFLPKGKVEAVDVTAADTIVLPTNTSTDGEPGYEIICSLNDDVTAPVTKGDTIGVINIEANGEIIASTDMLAAE
ncbi:MAG: D-alanyl-D-alanine carboxypeptidase family protein, partial [Bacillota bacterium]|nr:D-alanyl-D-alanine carboxypeptidase family protein [Bacillota bacterium]